MHLGGDFSGIKCCGTVQWIVYYLSKLVQEGDGNSMTSGVGLKQVSGKIIVIVLGSIVMGYGITLAMKTGYGADPLAWVWDGMAQKFHISVPTANLALSILMLLPVIFIDKKQIGVGTIIQPLVVSGSISFFMPLLDAVEGNYIVSIIGLTIIGIGSGIYNCVNFGRNSYDCCVFIIAEKTGFAVGKVRSVCDLVLCAIAYIMTRSFIVNPIIAIFFIGPVMNITLILIDKIKNTSTEKA